MDLETPIDRGESIATTHAVTASYANSLMRKPDFRRYMQLADTESGYLPHSRLRFRQLSLPC